MVLQFIVFGILVYRLVFYCEKIVFIWVLYNAALFGLVKL